MLTTTEQVKPFAEGFLVEESPIIHAIGRQMLACCAFIERAAEFQTALQNDPKTALTILLWAQGSLNEAIVVAVERMSAEPPEDTFFLPISGISQSELWSMAPSPTNKITDISKVSSIAKSLIRSDLPFVQGVGAKLWACCGFIERAAEFDADFKRDVNTAAGTLLWAQGILNQSIVTTVEKAELSQLYWEEKCHWWVLASPLTEVDAFYLRKQP